MEINTLNYSLGQTLVWMHELLHGLMFILCWSVQLLSAELQDEDAEKVEIHLQFALKQVKIDFPHNV